MGEIDGFNFSVNKVNFNGVQKQSPAQEEAVEQKTQITDFSDPKAESLGRSMLVKGNDSLNNDLKALTENPQIAENSDRMFEAAYKAALDAGLENPYEEAANVATTAM